MVRITANSRFQGRPALLIGHPDEASNASGRKDLGQLRASAAGSGFEIAKRPAPFALDFLENVISETMERLDNP